MAKKRKKIKRKGSSFSLQKFITLSVVVLAVTGIGLTVFASQQSTNTKSEAACSKAPDLSKIGSTNGAKNVTYHLRIKNNCPGWSRFILRVLETPDNKNWKWRFVSPTGEKGEWNTRFVRNGISEDKIGKIDLVVSRADIKNIKAGTYKPIKVSAAPRKDWRKRDILDLKYVVTNNNSGGTTSNDNTGSTGTGTNTNTTACNKAPSLNFSHHTKSLRNTVYYYNLINNCSGSNQFALKVIDTPSAPSGQDWLWSINGCGVKVNTGCVVKGVNGKKQIYLNVQNPRWATSGKLYSKFTVKASLKSNSSKFDTYSIIYKR